MHLAWRMKMLSFDNPYWSFRVERQELKIKIWVAMEPEIRYRLETFKFQKIATGRRGIISNDGSQINFHRIHSEFIRHFKVRIRCIFFVRNQKFQWILCAKCKINFFQHFCPKFTCEILVQTLFPLDGFLFQRVQVLYYSSIA